MQIKIYELTFSAAHYLAGHPKCGGIHGHTFFIRNFNAESKDASAEMVVDFGRIKDYFANNWDHKFIIDETALEFWQEVIAEGILLKNLRTVKGRPTCENIAWAMSEDLRRLFPDLTYLYFELYEGPNQGVKVQVKGWK